MEEERGLGSEGDGRGERTGLGSEGDNYGCVNG